ncbi:MAG: DUF805 domain-containing protein [Xanthomonadaceae bacterium]|nr:DUF805 domain-containing protein [Xanthomonadaceae bacterium]
MEWMLMPLKRYFDFEGRSRRKEYWMFVLLYTLLMIPALILTVAGIATSGDSNELSGMGALGASLFGLIILIFFIPSIAVQVRRFHDQDKSGWFVLLNLIPSIGGLIVLVFMCLEGTPGENRYGPDPKGPDARR